MTSTFEGVTLDGLDLNDGAVFAAAEVNLPAPPALVEWVRSADSDGSLLAREPPHDNAEGTIKLWVAQQATSDLMLAKVAQITDKLQEAQRNPGGVDLVWTPHDSTLSVTGKVLFGEITEMPISLDAGWIGNAPTVTIKLIRLPFWEGSEISDLVDDYSTNTIANYTLTGSGTLTVSGGVLVPSSTAAKILTHTSLPYLFTQAWVTAKFTIGASTASGTFGVNVRYLDASNYIRVDVAAAGASSVLRIAKGDVGVETNLATASCTITAATSYWIRARAEGNVLTAELFTAVPTFQSTPTATCTATLAGANLTKFGSGIAGRAGLVMQPQATDWRADDFWVQPNVTKSTEPVVTLELANVAGDVAAKVRCVVTDGATQNRKLIRAALESRYYPTASAPALLIDSASLVVSGFSGSATTRTGAYSANGVVASIGLPTQAVAVCGLGNLSHVGTFRVFARVWTVATSVGSVYCRLSWQEGSGPYRANQYVTPPAVNGFADISLGTITLPEKLLGTQRWTGQIEAYSSTLALADSIQVDYVYLLPIGEGYGEALAPYVYQPGTLSSIDDFEAAGTTGALDTDTAQVGGAWATSGSATDFVAQALSTPGKAEVRTAVSEAGLGRVALLGTTVTSNVEVSVRCYRDAASPAAGIANVQSILFARYVDSSNYLRAYVAPGYRLIVQTVVAASFTTVTSLNVEGIDLTAIWHRLRLIVYSSGAGYFALLGDNGNALATATFSSPVLATGGALDDGKVGFGDYNGTATAITRYYDEFYSGIPPSESVACYAAQSIEFREDDMLREDSTGTYWGPPPEPRAGLRGLPPAGTRARKSRLAVVARRNDVTTATDDQITDSTAVQVIHTPRYLNAPRA